MFALSPFPLTQNTTYSHYKVLGMRMGDHPAIARFSAAIQKLLVPEARTVEGSIAEGKIFLSLTETLSVIALSHVAICYLVDISFI